MQYWNNIHTYLNPSLTVWRYSFFTITTNQLRQLVIMLCNTLFVGTIYKEAVCWLRLEVRRVICSTMALVVEYGYIPYQSCSCLRLWSSVIPIIMWCQLMCKVAGGLTPLPTHTYFENRGHSCYCTMTIASKWSKSAQKWPSECLRSALTESLIFLGEHAPPRQPTASYRPYSSEIIPLSFLCPWSVQ